MKVRYGSVKPGKQWANTDTQYGKYEVIFTVEHWHCSVDYNRIVT
jgi:hypothetical protein